MIQFYHSTARSRALTKLEQPKAGSWCHAVEPTKKELDKLAEDFELDRDLLEDATDIYEAPRIEISDGGTYIFTRYCHPEGLEIATEPLLIIYTKDCVITIMRGKSTVLDQLINGNVEILTTQKTKLFLRILEQINRSYSLQLNIIIKKILRSRAQLRQSVVRSHDIIQFIEIEEDLNEFLSALQPQALVLSKLETGRYMKLYDDDKELIEDIKLSTAELIELSKTRIKTAINIRQAYDAIATNNLNKIFKRLTSIAIFLAIPTIVSGIFGMNVGLPLQHAKYAFLLVLAIIIAIIALMMRYFQKRDWL
jgi:magnesium transporter